MKQEVGRPTELDDELLLKIRGYVLDGLNMKEISDILDISYKTMESWKSRNYQGFSDKMLSYKHEHLIQKARDNIETSMDSEDERVRVDVSKWTLERLDKKNYSQRVENTGADGQPLVISFDESFKSKIKQDDTTSETKGDSGEYSEI